jgi:hypothetical protein
MTEQPQEPSDSMGGGVSRPLQEKLDEAAKLLEPILWATLEDDSDVYTVEDKPCTRCDEHHSIDKCGADSPDPDILYDEMHTLD